MKKLLLASILALPLLGAGLAVAGTLYSYPVVVSTANRYAYGNIGSARNAPDANQLLHCTVQGGVNASGQAITPSAFCGARDAAGVGATCTTTEAQFVNVVRSSIGTDSYITFNWNASGVCTSITVGNGSHHEPKR